MPAYHKQHGAMSQPPQSGDEQTKRGVSLPAAQPEERPKSEATRNTAIVGNFLASIVKQTPTVPKDVRPPNEARVSTCRKSQEHQQRAHMPLIC